MDTVAVDCLILGGGLSGLWLLNVLRRAGYSTLLIHDGPELGGIQSINSSGMIHGGPRLGIHLASREEQLPDMPLQWRNALCGSGELDLRDVRLLTPEQHLWCPGSDLRSRGTLLLAARNTTGRTRHLTPDQYPACNMPLGTLDRTPPPFFKQGPSALSRLILFSALALFLMVADTRLKVSQPLRTAVATVLYPLMRRYLEENMAMLGEEWDRRHAA